MEFVAGRCEGCCFELIFLPSMIEIWEEDGGCVLLRLVFPLVCWIASLVAFTA